MLIRALIVLLLVLNFGVAAWWLWSTPAPSGVAVDVPASVARLQLVRERDAAGSARVPVAAGARQAGAPMPAEAMPTGAPPSTVAATAIATAASGAPPATVATPADASRCFTFGPFDSEETLVAAQATLKPLTRALNVRRSPARPGRGWRVYLPPLASAEEATAVAGRIAAAGFHDYFIVREGAEANAVALGRFGTEAAASRHAQALNAAGFDARAEPLGEAAAAWVDVRAAAGFDAAAARAQIGAGQQRPADCGTLQ